MRSEAGVHGAPDSGAVLRLRTMRTTTTFVAAALALAACHGGKAKVPTSVMANHSGGDGETSVAGAGFRDGALWSCQISDYDPQPCKLTRRDGQWWLTKLLGSQRFAGELVELEGTLRFSGRFYCPWGDCTAEMRVEFRPDGDGYHATFEEDEIRLRHDDALEAEYGAAHYGGLTGDEQ